MSFFSKTIFSKIFRLQLLSIIFFSIIFSFYFISEQKRQILNSLKDEAKSIATMITYSSSDAIILDDGAYLVEFNHEFLKEHHSLKSLILSKSDKSSYIIKRDSWSFVESLPLVFSKEEKSVESWEVIYSPINKEEIFHYTYPILFNNISWGWLHLNMSLDDYNNKISDMYLDFLTFFIILFFISLLISYLVAKHFSKPISDLNKVANRISAGNLELRNTYESDDEIGQLSKSFNKMISKIEESQYQLKESHEELEKRVKDRTLELYEANKKQEELNTNLDKRVKEEVEKRRKQEGLLIQQSRLAAMGEMIGNIAHQWRQPLSAITTSATGVKLEKEFGLSTEEREIHSLDIIVETSNYLSNTIEDFSNFFKPNKRRVHFDVYEKVEQSLGLVSASFQFNHINVEKSCDTTKKVFGFPNEYSQAVLNILNNAKDALVKNSIKDPTIKIRIYDKDDFVYLEIEDNAGGIPKDILERIFEPYFTTKHNSQGTGIGLYMSKMIVEDNMQGDLYAVNSKDGAVFTIKVKAE